MKIIKNFLPKFVRPTFFLFIVLIFISFKTDGTRSRYKVPINAWSVTSGDIDLDGDNDIVVGHKTSWESTNPTISILENIDHGTLGNFDTTRIFCGYQENIILTEVNGDDYPDIISFVSDFSSGDADRYIRIFYNSSGSFDSYEDFSLHNNDIFSDIVSGDVNGDSYNDIIVALNNYSCWGILYNNGHGQFTTHEYFDSDYLPASIVCGDLNNDGRDDIIVAGSKITAYLSYSTGFEPLVIETEHRQKPSVVDFDLDGDNDIIAYKTDGLYFTIVFMYKNQGNNVFEKMEEFSFSPSSRRLLTSDFNNDSLPDMLFQLRNNSGYVIQYNKGDFQLGDSLFVALSPASPEESWRNCHTADIDGNGYNDIITVKTSNQNLPDNLEILFNDGKGGFIKTPINDIETSKSETQTTNLVCYPNPSHAEITLSFEIENKEKTLLQIFDLNGRLIQSIINEVLEKGDYKVKWNTKDEKGKEVKAGIYIIHLVIGNQNFSSRVIYQK